MGQDRSTELPRIPISLHREPGLPFHHAQGRAWLQASQMGANSTPVAYAAFEFRLAIERVALEFLVRVQGTEQTKADLSRLRSYKAVEKQIRRLAGHQRTIDRSIQFQNLLLEAAGAKFTIIPIQISKLSRHWHECSEFC